MITVFGLAVNVKTDILRTRSHTTKKEKNKVLKLQHLAYIMTSTFIVSDSGGLSCSLIKILWPVLT